MHPRRLLAAVRWYLREVSGDAAYERHCERHRRENPDRPSPTRREYEAWRRRRREETPICRCC
ncbi:CstA-like transporter-associated (seleno)protein [Streptodolium elevatio]|uniref:CstA-like transporter-associated (Seleno)protein n=1 Tax=Streptodolium elevatio TaxID=3157996 RepID=A0ABV3DJ84_9ACTN